MRKAIHIQLLAAAGILLLAAACKKESLITYNASDNIYFDYRSGVDPSRNQLGVLADSLDYTFAYSQAGVKDTLFPIPIAITGAPVNASRTYKVIVDAGATAAEGTHYQFTPLIVRPGHVVDTMFIRFKRAADLRQGKVSFTLRMAPNESFATELRNRTSNSDTVNALRLKITLSDMLLAGPDWDISYYRYFGAFSEKKMRLINQVFGMPLNFWAGSGGMSSAQIAEAVYYATAMGRYLRQQAAAGQTVYEADGVTRMVMGTDFQ